MQAVGRSYTEEIFTTVAKEKPSTENNKRLKLGGGHSYGRSSD
jgi:hypothetical protein